MNFNFTSACGWSGYFFGEKLGIQEASTRQTLVLDDNRTAARRYGNREGNLRALEAELEIVVHARGNEIRLTGLEPKVLLGKRVLEELYGVVRGGREVGTRDVREAIKLASDRPDMSLRRIYEGVSYTGLGAHET